MVWLSVGLLLALLLFYVAYKEPFAEVPVSTAVFDRDGGLMGARVAQDGQWRFAAPDSLPDKYRMAVLAFEDRYFKWHPGVNPVSLIRAVWQNLSAGEVISGGSTITMQVIRLSRNHPPRTIGNKLLEMLLAVQLELHQSKSDILRLYAGYVPMGGNVVGLEAASWRYFGRSPQDLSWGEAATLAVLPNAPSVIHPGRNREVLLHKRNRLLDRLLKLGAIDSLTCELASLEPLPGQPLPLPDRAPHLTERYMQADSSRVLTTIDPYLQSRSLQVLQRHQQKLEANRIYNLALLVLDHVEGEVLVYHGNSSGEADGQHGRQVDIIHSERSSGSVLKPFLYAGMLDAGEILPRTLVADIPTRYPDFVPNNFNKEFDGAVHADEALIRSLNVPAVRMLRQFGVLRFYHLLKDLGVNTLHRSAEDYGLSLILGGAEISLWNIAQVYSALARSLNGLDDCALSEPAIWLAFEAMKRVSRPDSEAGWGQFLSGRDFAWKTGTSYGFRDAWAIGVNPQYTIAVWAGNADGAGRPGLTGASVAAPVMFEVMNLLPPDGGWFRAPPEEVQQVLVCRESGMLAGTYCREVDTIEVPLKGVRTGICPYHILIHLDSTQTSRVHGDCYPVTQMKTASWFVLPPVMAWYYALRDPLYRPLPPWKTGCLPHGYQALDILYPEAGEEVALPRGTDGIQQQVVAKAVHQSADATLFWFLDGVFIQRTRGLHQIGLRPDPGSHELHVSDQEGNSVSRTFRVR